MLSLQLTDNSKTGPAFTLSRTQTCINKTAACAAACYGNSIRYRGAQKKKREKNYETCVYLLEKAGPDLLAENLECLIDRARPASYLAGVEQEKDAVPFSLRLHDIGDYFSIDYVQAWWQAAKNRPSCRIWFYTRSFVDPEMLSALTEFAALPNVRGWLSIDLDNYRAGVAAYLTAPQIWGLAVLQEEPWRMTELFEHISQISGVVSFPRHRSGHHVQPVNKEGVFVCPKVTGVLASHRELAPCQLCSYCLPPG